MVIQLASICEEEEIELSKDIHALDMKNNEWHIAIMQIYENLFRDEAPGRWKRKEIRFDEDGNYLEPSKNGPNAIEVRPNISQSLRPLLEYIDEYRRRNAAPDESIIRKKYSNYADLDYIKNRLSGLEKDVYG